MGALASGVEMTHGSRVPQVVTEERSAKIGRPVRAVSIGFKPGLPLMRIADLVDREGTQGTDIIALPETCRGQDDKSQETLDGPTISAMAHLAQKASNLHRLSNRPKRRQSPLQLRRPS